ncbi:MAG: hypothetical protein GYA39_06935 [Methanothrix sp.]|nr:hypothetical protein [Methanothrix sp.]
MEGYQIWLAFLALAIVSLSIIQLQISRNKRLKIDRRQMQIEAQRLHDDLRDRTESMDRLQHDFAQLLKWRDRAIELEKELWAAKQKERYFSAQRLQFLEDCIASPKTSPNASFLVTFPSRGVHSFEDNLLHMLERAEFEIIIVSPWIKMQTWNRIKAPLNKFARRGGRLKVFMRDCEVDYKNGMSDDIHEEVAALGGEIVPVDKLHAKIYLVDRREAIITSANLTKGGIDDNYEAGVWLRDPAILKEICAFVEDLRVSN